MCKGDLIVAQGERLCQMIGYEKSPPEADCWLSKNAQGAGGSSPCRVWAEPTFLVPQHFQESTASTEGARFAALTDKNEVSQQAEAPHMRR